MDASLPESVVENDPFCYRVHRNRREERIDRTLSTRLRIRETRAQPEDDPHHRGRREADQSVYREATS
jgi:hypothetical protein